MKSSIAEFNISSKKVISLLLIIFLLIIQLPTQVFATYSDAITIRLGDPWMTVNGIKKEIDPGRNTIPSTVNDRTLVPIRVIVEEMGGTVGWENSTKRVDIDLGIINIKLWLDKKDAMINGAKVIMDVPPMAINDRTMVPLRFVTENLGADVEWDNAKKEALIKYNKINNNTKGPGENPGKDSDLYAAPDKPVFFMDNRVESIGNNKGQVFFSPDILYRVRDYTGFRVYYTDENNNYEVYDFDDNGFWYDDVFGKTIDLKIVAVNHTVESEPLYLQFAMLSAVKGDVIWSERKTEDLFGAPCWYGLSWQPLEGAVKYEVHITNDVISYGNFKLYGNLSGFSSTTVIEPNFSTKNNTGLPSELVNATWGTSRYLVIFPVNKDNVRGSMPRHYLYYDGIRL